MCSGYVAGGNTQFFGSKDGVVPDILFGENITSKMTERLSFNDDAAGEYQSMLAFCAHYGDGAKRDQVISISERLLPWEVTSGNTKEYFPGGLDNYKRVKQVLHLEQIHYGEDQRAAENQDYISQVLLLLLLNRSITSKLTRSLSSSSQGSMNNALCFVGPHRKYNPFSKQMHELM